MTTPIASLTTALADRYRIERELGAGGMATVYLAHDLKHDRQVAIKVLRPELAAVIGADRFLAEIRTTANLQHPHILPLFDSGVSDSFLYYVMPLVEGETLRDRLARDKQLPIADAVRIAGEIASALDYAHRHGVIHRDIKPENILLHDGRALVADFGIALAASKAGSRMTETGMSLGTPAYMSPEQAMGEREISPRSDVYALGCVLYEMLCGEPPFGGPTAQAIVAKVLTEEPRPLLPKRHTIPPYVEEAVLTALEKLPADRFASAAEFASALQGDGSTIRQGGMRVRTARPPDRRTALLPWLVAAVLVPAAFVAGAWLWHPGLPPIAGFGRATKVTWDPGLEISPAISPDGKYVAYAAGNARSTRVYVRQVAGGRPIALTSSATAQEAGPTWSPDGSRILFLAEGGVFSAPATGGAPRPEIPALGGSPITDASWSPDGKTIAFAMGDSVFVTTPPAAPRLLARALAPGVCRWSPSGELLACMSGNTVSMSAGVNFGNLSPSQIVVIRVATGDVIPVTDNLSPNLSPAWSPDGRWLYFVSGRDGPRDIYALRLSGSGTPRGKPIRLTTGLGAQAISLSHDGSRIGYNAFSSASNIWSVPWPAGRPRTAAEATQVTTGQNTIDLFRLSPDGRWLLFSADVSGNSDIYQMPVGGGEMEQLTTTTTDNFAPDLSPDGKELAFHSWRGGSRDVYVMPMGGGATQQITSSPDQEFLPVWSPDGKALAYSIYSNNGGIWVVRRDDAGKWGTPIKISDKGLFPQWSPDGRAIAFEGRLALGSLYTIPPTGGPAHLVLQAGGQWPTVEDPKWTLDGRSILFKTHDAAGNGGIWTVPAQGGVPRLLVRLDDPDRPSMGPFWTASATTIYFLSEEWRSDIAVMEILPR